MNIKAHASDWRAEFPGMTDMPDLIPEMVDTSQHNDLSPSFAFLDGAEDGADSMFLVARVWVDYPDPADREDPTAPRYSIVYDNYRGTTFTALKTDLWSHVLCYVIPRVMASEAYRKQVGYCPFLDDPSRNARDVVDRLIEIRGMA